MPYRGATKCDISPNATMPYLLGLYGVFVLTYSNNMQFAKRNTKMLKLQAKQEIAQENLQDIIEEIEAIADRYEAFIERWGASSCPFGKINSGMAVRCPQGNSWISNRNHVITAKLTQESLSKMLEEMKYGMANCERDEILEYCLLCGPDCAEEV